ncbi:MAG: DUF1232 domain-containing protein [Armatimonadetes bacterium]|nr:DUF1232 domain-containing protein [Armatimonadota bacterium]MBS1701452.1 DUF1232 domain-containing protein [Armatimonadota bacterium]MBS1725496.1 DUF1232 domain-containing protein [Armatimonadota bacterium]
MNQTIRFAKAAKNADNPWPVRIACALATAYLLFPFDVLPDFLPVIGWLDDFLVVFGVVMWVVNRRRNRLPVQS